MPDQDRRGLITLLALLLATVAALANVARQIGEL